MTMHSPGLLFGGSLAPTHYAIDIEADLYCKTAVARDQAFTRWRLVATAAYRPGQALPTAGDRRYALERLAELVEHQRAGEADALTLFSQVRKHCPDAWRRIARCIAENPDADLSAVLAARRKYVGDLAAVVAALRPEIERASGMASAAGMA